MKEKTQVLIGVLLGTIAIMMLLTISVTAQPTGTNTTRGVSSRGANSTITNQTAEAGNVTGLNVNQQTITGIWQGFYGNVTGQIVLENGVGDNFYDWTFSSISGEIFATRVLVPDWSAINCTNSTHWEEEETELNIESTDIDGINETYSSTTHPSFDVGSQTGLVGCPSTQPYNESGSGSNYWNVLLNPNATITVYAALINTSSNNFENGTSDFEILVPVDENTGTAVYFFYAELA